MATLSLSVTMHGLHTSVTSRASTQSVPHTVATHASHTHALSYTSNELACPPFVEPHASHNRVVSASPVSPEACPWMHLTIPYIP